MLDYKKAKKIIENSSNILIVGHIRPDGDAISSCLALSYLLDRINKKYQLFCSGNVVSHFNYLKNFHFITNNKKELDFKKFDLIISVDCGSLSRTDLSEEILKLKSNHSIKYLEIDHHLSQNSIADLELRDSSRAATVELIYDLLQTFNLEIDKDIAEAILTGLVTDTGNFFYPNVSSQTISLAAKLLNKGANLNRIVQQVKKGTNMHTLKLWGLAMERLTIHKKYNFAFSVLSKKDLQALDIEEGELNETLSFIAGFLSNLANVKATLLLYNSDNKTIKGHLRSANKEINVAKLANHLGGGGHSQAAGFIVSGELLNNGANWQVI